MKSYHYTTGLFLSGYYVKTFTKVTNEDGGFEYSAFYNLKGSIGLNPKQFESLLKNEDIKYTGELVSLMTQVKDKYYKKYSFVLPVYFLSQVYKRSVTDTRNDFYTVHDIGYLESTEYKHEFLYYPFIYNKYFKLHSCLTLLDKVEINSPMQIPPLAVYIRTPSRAFKLLQEYNQTSD